MCNGSDSNCGLDQLYAETNGANVALKGGEAHFAVDDFVHMSLLKNFYLHKWVFQVFTEMRGHLWMKIRTSSTHFMASKSPSVLYCRFRVSASHPLCFPFTLALGHSVFERTCLW